MPIERIVINASPLIILFKAGLEDILPKLFNDICIPKAVWSEVTDVDYEDESVAAGLAKLRHSGLCLSDELEDLLLSGAGERTPK